MGITNDNSNIFEYQDSDRLREEAYINRCREYWRKEKENDKDYDTLRSKIADRKRRKINSSKIFEILFYIVVGGIISVVIVILAEGFPLFLLGALWVGAILLKCMR